MTRPWDEAPTAGSPKNRDSLELSARLWMRAYPRRWRVTFGDDLVAVLCDVTPPDARRVPVREAVGIVRAGWALRLRERPPFWRWLAYRFLGLRLPVQYRYWVMDDLLGPLFGFRLMTATLIFTAAWMSALNFFSDGALWADPPPIRFISIYFLIWLFSSVMGRKYRARVDWKRFIGTEPPRELQPRRIRRLPLEI